MTISRSDALIAYLACGWPNPDPGLIGPIQEAMTFGIAAKDRADTWSIQSEWRSRWASIAPENCAELITASGLRDVRLAHKVSVGKTFPTAGEYCAAMLGEILLPVMAHAYLDASGVLDEDAVERAGKRTQKSLAQGKGVTIVARCMDHARA